MIRLAPTASLHTSKKLSTRCIELHSRLPWSSAPASFRTSMRAGLAFCASLSQSPLRPGSFMQSLNEAFPPGSLPCAESLLFCSLARAEREMSPRSATPQFKMSDRDAARAIEVAPLIFGGLAWLSNSLLATSARLSFCQAMADAAARQAASGGRPDSEDAFFASLSLAYDLRWPSPPQFPLSSFGLVSGRLEDWPIVAATRETLRLREKEALEQLVAPAENAGRHLWL